MILVDSSLLVLVARCAHHIASPTSTEEPKPGVLFLGACTLALGIMGLYLVTTDTSGTQVSDPKQSQRDQAFHVKPCLPILVILGWFGDLL